MDCAGTGPEAALSLPGSQMHGHIAWLSLARLGKLQQVWSNSMREPQVQSRLPPRYPRTLSPSTASIPSTKPQPLSAGCCSSLEHPPGCWAGLYGWLWSKEQQQDGKALSPALLPRRSLPPPQQCCGESGASQSADCSDRWQVISPLANLTLEKKIGLGVIQLLGLKARGWRDSTLLWHVLEGCCIPEDCGNKSKVTIKQKSVCRIRQILLKMDNVLRVILSNWISISKMQILLIEFSSRNNLCSGSEATRAPLSFHP